MGEKASWYRLILRGEKLKRLMKKCVRGVSFYTLITSLIEKGIFIVKVQRGDSFASLAKK